MIKTIRIGIIFIVIGIILGDFLYSKYHTSFLEAFKEKYNYYFVQEGVYSNYDLMFENTKSVNAKTVEKNKDKYYVYVGISSNYDNAVKIKDIYEKEGYKTFIKEMSFDSEEFYTNVEQFDLLVDRANTDEEILTIEEVILANYEEIVKRSK